MTALAKVLASKKTCDALEADFRQYYQLALKDVYVGELCFTEAARLMAQLPHESRVFRLISGEPFSFEEHLLISMIDAARTNAYFASVMAMTNIDKRYRAKILKAAPQPIRKPPDAEKKVLKVPAREAKAAVSRIIQSKLAVRMAGR